MRRASLEDWVPPEQVRAEELESFEMAAAGIAEGPGGDEGLLADIAELKQIRGPRTDLDSEGNLAGLRKAVDSLGTILSYNFVIIVGFFLWFMTGCFCKFVIKTDIVIDGFTGLWEVLILPLLTTHMTLTFLSAGIEKFAFNDEA